jgi:DNA-binding Lrp family transcriptional regulator
MKTFTLINSEVGKAREVYAELKRIAGELNAEVYPLFGEWDFLVLAESTDLKSASDKVIDRLQKVAGVCRTRTLVQAEL